MYGCHVDQRVERAEGLYRTRHHPAAVRFISDIGAHSHEARRVRLQPFRRDRLQIRAANAMALCQQAFHTQAKPMPLEAPVTITFFAFAAGIGMPFLSMSSTVKSPEMTHDLILVSPLTRKHDASLLQHAGVVDNI